jgi:hypothetical protein
MVYPLGGDTRKGTLVIKLANRTSATLWRAGVLASLAWAVGGALDGATLSRLLTVPLIVAAWILAVVFLDRWVRARDEPG